MPETAPRKPALAALSVLGSFSPATGLGLALLVLFFVFCQFDNYVVRWWLMLPLAAAAAALLLWRRKRLVGLESRIRSGLLVLLLLLVVLRDVGLSRKLAELFDTMNGYKSQMDEATRELDRFFNGTR